MRQIIILFLFTLSLQCDAAQVCSGGGKTRYFYINGVSLSADEKAQYVVDEVELILQNSGLIAAGDTVSVLRNPSYSAVVDVLIEAIPQKIAEFASGAVSDVVAFWVDLFSGTYADTSQATKDSLAAYYADIINRSILLLSPGTNYVLSSQISAVLSELNAGNKVVLIAHSQGNMFANEILASITATNPSLVSSLKIVSVATPANWAQDMRYKTANQDLVIKVVPASLAANMNITDSISDTTGHGFLEVYLSDLKIDSTIFTALDNFIGLVRDALTNSTFPSSSTGFFTATMSWSGGFWNVDMEVLEPTSNNVSAIFVNSGNPLLLPKFGSYTMPNGLWNSPYIYQASCDSLVLSNGDYAISARQFGYDTRLVNISVADNKGSLLFTSSFTPSMSNGGAVLPSLVTTVSVTYDALGVPSASVQ